MNRLLAIATIAAMNVTLAAPLVLAESAPRCDPATRACAAPTSAQPKAPGKTPHPGESARTGRPFQQAAKSRFPTPPAGQQYRVVQDNLVLVDSKTMTIVKVLGLLDTLTR